MNHAGTSQFQPTGFTETAAGALTNTAGDVNFETGFGKLKVVRTESGSSVFPEIILEKIVSDADEMGDVYFFVDDHTFELVKHGGVRDVNLTPVGLANVDHF